MLALNCYNKRNPKKGIERPTSSPTSRSKFISEVTTKEIPKRELRVPERRPREAAGQSAVTTKEIPKRELRVNGRGRPRPTTNHVLLQQKKSQKGN
jgi:hypothetical protein